MRISIQSADTTVQLGVQEAYRVYAEAGFEAIDWGLDEYLPSWRILNDTYAGNNIYEKDVDEILAILSKELNEIKINGLAIGQAHAPFPPYLQDKPGLLDYMIEVYKKNIEICQRVGCKYLVIHGVSLTKKNRKDTPETIRQHNDKLYTSLIPTLLENDVVVCLENHFARNDTEIVAGFCSNPYEAAEIIDRYNDIAGKECFGLCLDTGHLNLLRQDVRSYIPIVGKRLKVLHIHDNDGFTDQHKAPYTGTIIWQDFCDELKKTGYDGDICFETFKQTSLKVIDRNLLVPWLELIYKIGDNFRDKIMKEKA